MVPLILVSALCATLPAGGPTGLSSELSGGIRQELSARWAPRPAMVYAGQTFRLALELEIATSLRQERLIQLFPQELALPLQVTAFERVTSLELATEFAAPPDGDAAARGVAIDGGVAPFIEAGHRVRDGARFDVIEIAREARAARAGTFSLAPPLVHYAVASAFREDLVRGSVPLDRSEVDAVGAPLEVTVLPIPEQDRPTGFIGAVGTFTLVAACEPSTVRLGESLTLDVTVQGAGALDRGIEPNLNPAAGFDVLGQTELSGDGLSEDAGASTRVFRFDLRPKDLQPVETPVATLAFFDPAAEPPSFRTVTSNVLPIAVAPSRIQESAAEGAPADDSEAPTATEEDDEVPLSSMPWTLGMLALVFGLAIASVIARQGSQGASQGSQGAGQGSQGAATPGQDDAERATESSAGPYANEDTQP